VYTPGVAELGIRDLRADLAAHVRRAAAGEVSVVTVNGRPAAVLAPLDAAPSVDLAALIASGAVLPPRRTDGRSAIGSVAVWGNVRLDRLLREVRG
jgi:prevent-host-death family protein